MEEILKVENLSKSFYSNNEVKKVLKDINFSLRRGEILGIIGESGSGKSTLLRLISNQIPKDSGTIKIFGKDYKDYGKEIYKSMQMIFQDARSSFNPRCKIGRAFNITKKYLKLDNAFDNKQLLKMVGLKEEYEDKFPKELSGGECQRAAIARAFSVKPKFLLCDEITSALDVCAQAKIIDLLIDLCEEYSTGVLFVSHDLALVSSFCSRILILKHGEIVEYGDTKSIIKSPSHPYTVDLLEHMLVI